MSQFNATLMKIFDAKAGAFSVVTVREATGDKSVTTDKDEKSVLFSKYDENGFARGAGSEPNAYRFFNVWNNDERKYDRKRLAIKYPKKKGAELRLYFNRDSGFYPSAGDVWFIFERTGVKEPFIGAMSQSRWDDLSSSDPKRRAYIAACDLDDEDEAYQMAIQSPSVQQAAEDTGPDTPKEKDAKLHYTVTRHKRSAALAAREIQKAHHTCQFDSEHKTFRAGSTGSDYVEVHHLVPVAASAEFENSLDVSANLVVLCPLCHRAIHYGDRETKRKLLDHFFADRENRLKDAGIDITKEDLYRIYQVSDGNEKTDS